MQTIRWSSNVFSSITLSLHDLPTLCQRCQCDLELKIITLGNNTFPTQLSDSNRKADGSSGGNKPFGRRLHSPQTR